MPVIKSILRLVLFLTISVWVFNYYLNWDYEPTIDPALEKHVMEWRKDMDSAGIVYKYGWDRLQHIKLLECDNLISDFMHDYGNTKFTLGMTVYADETIIIDSSAFDGGDDLLKYIVYHELGHYMFRLDHTDHDGIMTGTWRENMPIKENWNTYKYNYINSISNKHR